MAEEKSKTFTFENIVLPVKFVETIAVTQGVTCDVYAFEGDVSKDLGIVTIEPGCKTSLREVLSGEKTIEGFISGKGTFIVSKPTGEKQTFLVSTGTKSFEHEVAIGEKMQWQASGDSSLMFYEICYPPYQEGRFRNIS